jgi:Ca2+/Na+ antiporter
MGGSSIVGEKTRTKEQQIEENDERNITIVQTAKSKAYDLMATLFPFALLALALFGYMNEVSLFLLIGVYFICIIYFAYHLYKNKKKM